MAVAQLKDGRWVCYYRMPVDPATGKSRVKKEYFGRGQAGETAARKRNDELDLKKRRPVAIRSGPSFSECAAHYIANHELAPTTREVCVYELDATIIPALGHRDALGLTYHDMDSFVKKRRADRVKDSSIAREITIIKAILNYAVSVRPPIIPRNPIRDYPNLKVSSAVIMPPTSVEIKNILQNAPAHLQRAITLSYYLGLRPGAVELLSLRWHAVNWENNTILVMSAHKGGPEKRSVPIHDDFKAVLSKWHTADKNTKTGPIVHYHGKPISTFKTAWKSTLQKAKIKRRLRPYDIRHFFITQALESGADIKALSEIVGSSPTTLMRHYQHVSTALHRATVAKIPAIPSSSGDTKYPQKRKAGTKKRPGLTFGNNSRDDK